MKTILITTSSFSQNDPGLLKRLEAQNLRIILNPYGRKLTEGEVIDLFVQHRPVGMIAGVEPLTRQALSVASDLKVISRCGIGIDAVDIEEAESLNIIVTITPDGPTIAVAELALGMILSLLRRIHTSDASIRNGEWVRPMGNLLHGKTVGLIGCGRIGCHLAKLLAAFDVTILGCDPVCVQNDNFSIVNSEQLFSRSDIISLHIPYTPENHHFINRGMISLMKKGSVLINAARGGILDEEALYDAIQSGHLSGAAIDCFEEEPYRGKLRTLDNVLLTGHIGSYAREGRIMMEKQAMENLLRELQIAGITATE